MVHTHTLGPGNGPFDAEVLFIAEAVGRRGGAITGVPLTRDETGRRFEAFLAIAGLSRDEIFVTNSVLCHPADAWGRNRAPAAAEVARCNAFLTRTLELVLAPLVVALGRVALEALRGIASHEAQLVADAARPLMWRGRVLVPMYHPGRQATLHRPQHLQESDWRDLGDIARAMDPARPFASARP
jgi:uracil-DNA glycosylase family 4